MLADRPWLYVMRDSDYEFYAQLLPRDHPLLDALELIPWDSFTPLLRQYYSLNHGQPAIDPLLMLKLEFLRYFCRLSDREVISRCQTDVVYRYFLQVPVFLKMPASTSLVNFRGRLGVDGFQKVFDHLITIAREMGLVRDRLRLKDATHIIAKIAVPHTLKLFAQLREKLHASIKVIAPVVAEGFQIDIQRVQAESVKADDEIRLQQRVELVQEMHGWLVEQLQSADRNPTIDWQKVEDLCQLASKILGDTLQKGKGDRTLSVVDPEARRSKHGGWYDGYSMDLMMDADSELITAVDVLVAGGDEAQSALNLVKTEQQAQGNHVEAVSIDGVGFNGPMLREFEDPEGLAVTVYTPPRKPSDANVLSVAEFQLSETGDHVTCPAGHQSSTRQRDKARHRSYFQFARKTCEGCPLMSQCQPVLGKGVYGGRGVTKNDYEAEHQRMRARAKTEQYAAVRSEHPAVERKLNEVVNHHDARHAKYWGHDKVKKQALMTCMAVDLKRMLRLRRGVSAPAW